MSNIKTAFCVRAKHRSKMYFITTNLNRQAFLKKNLTKFRKIFIKVTCDYLKSKY